MILAGPGSGKTTVVTNRILNMIDNCKVNPENILVITFTRMAALQMKERFLKLASESDVHDNAELYDDVTFGTFHSVFFRILRYFENYNIESILDEKTKRIGLKNILKGLNIENADDDETIGQVINEISYVKNELMDKRDFKSEVLTNDEFIKVYNFYEEYKQQMNKIDFDDMLIKTYELLKNNKAALDRVRSVYRYILVKKSIVRY